MTATTEDANPRYAELDAWPSLTAVEALWDAQMDAVAAVRPALPAISRAAELAAERLAGGGRLAYCGAGTSGRIGVQDGAELSPTFDWPSDRLILLMAGGQEALLSAVENAEDDAEAARQAIASHDLGPRDVLVAVAASGATPYTVACATEAKRKGVLVIGVANNPGSVLLDTADVAALAQTGAEPVAGSTRLKAGTAQKVVLNLFSTTLMLRLNRVHRGLMVDMLPRNEKLRRRAIRMTGTLACCTDDQARQALDAADGKVKLAVLIARGASRTRADAALAEAGGNLRTALSRLHPDE